MQPSLADHPSSPLIPASIDRLRKALGGLGHHQGIDWDLHSLTDAQGSEVEPLDSSSVGPRHWLAIAQAIERVYAHYDGFIIIHGTDTMAYTASALSFLLVNLAKPVVVTGSQTPIFQERTDATLNFLNALYVAGYKATGLPLVPEVTIGFGDHLLRGNRTRKVSVNARAGFASPNYPALATFTDKIIINTKRVRRPPPEGTPFYVDRRLDDQVMDLTLYPGVKGSQLRPFFERTDLKGFILRTFGSGTTPRDPELLTAVAQAALEGKMLLIITQCLEGGVDLGRYDASTTLLEPRILSGFDLTPEAALTKLMWMMALEDGPERDVQMQMCHRGEQSFEQYHLNFPPCQNCQSQTYSAHLPAPIDGRLLRRALIRVRDTDAHELRFFTHAAYLDPDASLNDARCLGGIHPKKEGGLLDITEALRQRVTPHPSLRLTITGAGASFSLGRVDLTVLLEVDN